MIPYYYRGDVIVYDRDSCSRAFQPDMIDSAFMRLGCRQDKVERQGKTRPGRARRGPARAPFAWRPSSRSHHPRAKDERVLPSAADTAFSPSSVVAHRGRKPILMGHDVRPLMSEEFTVSG